MPAKWNYPTPTGFVYTMPRSVAEIKYQEVNCAQASIEKWDDPEVPPDPTWEMVAILLDEIDRVGHVCDQVGAEFNDAFLRPDSDGQTSDYYLGAYDAVLRIRTRFHMPEVQQ